MTVSNVDFDNEDLFTLIAGPCVIESREQVFTVAKELIRITNKLGVDLVFKSSFDKANRSSIDSYRGPGIEQGLEILDAVRDEFDVPVITDFHTPEQTSRVAEVVDILQIPAFLSRQTDMLTAAGESGLPVHVKKGQFMAAEGMQNVVEKVHSTGNEDVLLCERGSMYGYNNLVVDVRNIEIMKETGKPVVFDTTHSVQRPGSKGDETGGDRQFAPALGRAAVANGVAGVFAEVHPEPTEALCDAATQLRLDEFELHLRQWVELDRVARSGDL